jgi:RNA polymerase sigma-70 factor, ECF subfamily
MTDTKHELPPALRESVAQSRRAFIAAAADLRPRLHRFCARMCGSSLDGEDVVQETLAEGFYKLASLKDASRFEPWLFRIAYHKCIDFLRREQRYDNDVALDEDHEPAPATDGDDLADAPIDDALITLVGALPPMERASVLLKDVLGYSLAEVADIADSTVGGVKAALHRARTKLRATTAPPTLSTLDVDQRRLFEAYAECFNRRDWDALRTLVSADARLEIVGSTDGDMAGLGATYSSNYTNLPWEWRLDVAVVDGSTAIVHSRRADDAWTAHAAIRLWWQDGRVIRIRDYVHIDYLLQSAGLATITGGDGMN